MNKKGGYKTKNEGRKIRKISRKKSGKNKLWIIRKKKWKGENE